MSFVIHSETKVNGVPTDGIECVAYAESRFGGTPPVLGSPFPDMSAADAGPTPSGEAYGGVGQITLTVPNATNFWIGCYDVTNPSLIAWEGPKMATPHTSKQSWTAEGSYPSRAVVQTTLNMAPGSLPQTSLTVVSTSGFTSSGFLYVNAGTPSPQLVQYTGTSGGNTFTGCTGGVGSFLNGNFVIQAYINGNNRRLLLVSFEAAVSASGDFALGTLIAELDSVPVFSANGGIVTWTPGSSTPFTGTWQTTAPVDPGGAYCFRSQVSGSGTLTLENWVEVDF